MGIYNIANTFCVVLTCTFPPLSVTLLFVWSYWTMIFKVYLILYNGSKFCICITTFAFVLSLWTYYKVLYTGSGSPVDYPELRGENVPLCMSDSITMKRDGRYRYCTKCRCWKPDRTHHCSVCDKCILKMDHHCPWFGICIGYKNYRFFVQFLCWSLVYLLVVTSMTFNVLYGFFVDGKWDTELFSVHVLLVFCLGVVFTLCIGVFTGFTIYQMCRNRTTIESYERQRYRHTARRHLNVFDLGVTRNVLSIMGTKWYNIVMPVGNVEGDNGGGVSFETNLAGEEFVNSRNLVARLSSELERSV